MSRYAGDMPAPKSIANAPPGEWLAQMAQVIDEMLWVRDAASGRVLYTNPAFEQFWGADTARGEGDALIEFVAESDRDHIRRLRAEVKQSPYTTEYQVQLPVLGKKPARTARL